MFERVDPLLQRRDGQADRLGFTNQTSNLLFVTQCVSNSTVTTPLFSVPAAPGRTQ